MTTKGQRVREQLTKVERLSKEAEAGRGCTNAELVWLLDRLCTTEERLVEVLLTEHMMLGRRHRLVEQRS